MKKCTMHCIPSCLTVLIFCIDSFLIVLWNVLYLFHDDVIEWKHFPRYWPFVREIHRSPVNSPQWGQWRWSLMFSLISAWTNGGANHRDIDDLRRHRAHYDITVMLWNVFLNGFTWKNVQTQTQFFIQRQQSQMYIHDGDWNPLGWFAF